MISEKDYNEIYLKGYEDGKNDNNNLKIHYEVKPSFTTRKIKELKQENKQLKDNWNYIKKMLKEARQEEFNITGYCGTCTDVDIDFLLNKMQELERK